MGHSLVTCLMCGTVYAVTLAKELYVGPDLAAQMSKLKCTGCGVSLQDNWAEYPATFVVDGVAHQGSVPDEIPPDGTSVIKEFPGVCE